MPKSDVMRLRVDDLEKQGFERAAQLAGRRQRWVRIAPAPDLKRAQSIKPDVHHQISLGPARKVIRLVGMVVFRESIAERQLLSWCCEADRDDRSDFRAERKPGRNDDYRALLDHLGFLEPREVADVDLARSREDFQFRHAGSLFRFESTFVQCLYHRIRSRQIALPHRPPFECNILRMTIVTAQGARYDLPSRLKPLRRHCRYPRPLSPDTRSRSANP